MSTWFPDSDLASRRRRKTVPEEKVYGPPWHEMMLPYKYIVEDTLDLELVAAVTEAFASPPCDHHQPSHRRCFESKKERLLASSLQELERVECWRWQQL